MRFMDRVIHNQNQYLRESERKTDFQQDGDIDEMGYAYQDRKPLGFLNEEKGAFAYEDKTSINTAPSVFEKTTVFHISQEDV